MMGDNNDIIEDYISCVNPRSRINDIIEEYISLNGYRVDWCGVNVTPT